MKVLHPFYVDVQLVNYMIMVIRPKRFPILHKLSLPFHYYFRGDIK